MRQKDQLDAALNQVKHRAMGDLRGKTKTGIRFELAAWVDFRQDDLHAQSGEEGRVERIERMSCQCLGNADVFSVGWAIAVGAAKEQLAPLLHQSPARLLCAFFVSRRSHKDCSGRRRESAVPATSKWSMLQYIVQAPQVNRLVRFISGAARVKQSIALPIEACGRSEREQRHSQRAEQLRAGRNHHLAADAMSERVSDRVIQSDAPLQENLLAYIAGTLDAVEIIVGDGVNQAGDDVLARLAFLQGDADIGVDECRAGRLELHGGGSGEREIGDLRNIHAEIAVGAFFEKGTGARGTGVIHRVVDGNAVAQVNVFGILAADFKDRVDLAIEMGGAGRMSRNLIVDMLGAKVGAGELARRTGGA